MSALRKISSRDVATQAGVSQTTVSYVLNGREDVAIPPATRQRVLDAARELGYRANRSAKAMRSGRFGSVSLLLSEDPSMSILPVERLGSILDSLEAQETHLIVSRFSDATLTDRQQMPRILREIMADGLLINYNANLPEQMAEVIRQNRIPAFWMNSRQAADCAYPDDYGGAKQATEYLLALGHWRIAFACFHPSAHYSFTDREAGYADAMREARLPAETLQMRIDLTSQKTIRATTPWLQGDNPTTAILTYSWHNVFPLIPAALALGLSLPDDLSLMTFHSAPVTDFGRTVGAMILPEHEIGRRSVEALLAKIDDPAQTFAPIALPLELAPGDTTGPPTVRQDRR